MLVQGLASGSEQLAVRCIVGPGVAKVPSPLMTVDLQRFKVDNGVSFQPAKPGCDNQTTRTNSRWSASFRSILASPGTMPMRTHEQKHGNCKRRG